MLCAFMRIVNSCAYVKWTAVEGLFPFAKSHGRVDRGSIMLGGKVSPKWLSFLWPVILWLASDKSNKC